MDSPSRRKKRFTKPYYYLSPFRHFPSVRSLLFCFSFFTLLYLFSNHFFKYTSSFHPVLVVSSLSMLSSSTENFLENHPSKFSLFSTFKIEDRVLFPDHVLLLVSKRESLVAKSVPELECVYFSNNSDSGYSIAKRDVLSVDEYNEIRLIVRCPLPPVNFSPAVTLQRRGKTVINLVEEGGLLKQDNHQTVVSSWENVAYEAALDGNTAVVFVKGLSHRPDRESDPSQFSCHFGLGNLKRNEKFVLTTKAVTVAQEVVRCLLPRSIAKNPDKARGIRVSISVMSRHLHSRVRSHVVVPSVAKICSTGVEGEAVELKRTKHKLCVCTMVWNQAYSLREWITYHSWLGVERWFIYDNNSDDEIKEVIYELGEYNVSRHVWPWIKTQEAGFSHCALRAREDCEWVSFMDVDEFFYFPHPSFTDKRMRNFGLGYPGQNSLRNLVSNLSLSSSTIGEIRTTCHSFGPSGLSSLPPQGATVGYTCRLQSPERHKSIVRPDALDRTLLNVVHHFHLRKGFRSIDLPQRTAVINHYKYQVWEAFRAKFKRRVATYVADWQDNQNEGSRDRAPGLGTEPIEPPNWRLQFCEVWDTGLRDFVLANLADPVTRILPWGGSAM